MGTSMKVPIAPELGSFWATRAIAQKALVLVASMLVAQRRMRAGEEVARGLK